MYSMPLNITKVLIMAAKQGRTQTQLADKAGISRPGLSAIMIRGSCRPDKAVKLAAALGVAVEEILKEA